MKATRLLLIGVCLGFLIMPGCKPAGEEITQPAQTNIGSGQSQEAPETAARRGKTPTGQDSGGDYASQSQSVLVGGTSPYGYGAPRIVYEHHFTFNYSGGSTNLNMQINVKGHVPLHDAFAGESSSSVCNWTGYKPNYFKFNGSGKIDVTGSASFGTGDNACTCQFSDKVDVVADAVTTYEAA